MTIDSESSSHGVPHQLTLVVRRNLGRCAHEPQEGFVVAKLLVGTPTPAGGSVSEGMSIRLAYRRNIEETNKIGIVQGELRLLFRDHSSLCSQRTATTRAATGCLFTKLLT
jgi:hypothetical protein